MTACPTQVFVGTATGFSASCTWCGSLAPHAGTCPRLKEIEYYPNGLIKRVVLHDG